MIVNALLASAAVLGSADKAVEVPFILGDDAIIAKAVVNGREVSCMFDTGFSGSFVLTDQINIGKPSGSMTLRDFVGEFQAQTTPIKTLALGSQKINCEDMAAVQQPGNSYTLSYNTHTVGIMGLEVMQDFVLEINFEKKKFVLHPQTFDFTQWKPDNKKTFMAKMAAKGMNSIELQVETSNGKKMNLALDTGNAFYGTTHKDVLERIGIWPQGQKPNFMSTAFVASGAVDSWYMAMNDLKIFGVPVPNSIWSIIDLPSSSVSHDGTVGFGFLKNFNIIIDQKRRRVWLDNFSGQVADPPMASAGLSAWFYDEYDRFVVTNVTPGGPAAKAGIRRGDMILGVNDEEALNIGPRAFMRLMEGPQGSKVKLSLSRGGVLNNFEITREYLFNGKIQQTGSQPAAASAGSAGQ